MIRTIVVAFDGSDHAKKALALAAEIGAKFDARLVVLHALLRDASSETLRKLALKRALTKEQRELLDNYEIDIQSAMATAGMAGSYGPIPAPRELLEPIGRQVLARAEEAAKAAGVKKVATALTDGDPGDAIVEHAKREKADLIVMGTRGFGEFKGMLLGSVSHKVSARAPCAVLTVK
jgi:nucleotide-binding universal stress UspA family protein